MDSVEKETVRAIIRAIYSRWHFASLNIRMLSEFTASFLSGRKTSGYEKFNDGGTGMVHDVMRGRRTKRKRKEKRWRQLSLKSAISMREMYERDLVHVGSNENVCKNTREHALSITVAVLEFLAAPL